LWTVVYIYEDVVHVLELRVVNVK